MTPSQWCEFLSFAAVGFDRAAPVALRGFGADKGHGGGQAGDERGQGGCHADRITPPAPHARAIWLA